MDLQDIKPGDEIFFADKSEGPGVVFYIQGIAIGIGEADVTLEITDSGALIASGYTMPYDPGYTKGNLIKVAPEKDFEFLSPNEFSELREQYEVVPAGTTIDDPEPPAEEDKQDDEDLKQPVPLGPASEEERKVLREEIEEGAPDVEEEGGLYLTANLKSWGNSQGIFWPKGFPQDWMEQVYKDLPEGAAWESGGEPVVAIPGKKGPGVPPDAKADLEKEFNDASKTVQDAAKRMDSAKAGLAAAEEMGDKDVIAEKEKERKNAVEAFERAKKDFLAVTKKIGGEEGVWVRPPDETTYEQIPGKHAPRDIAFGKAGLRQALKQLSNNYKNTVDLIGNIDQTERRTDLYQKELDLLLRLRKKQLVEKGKDRYVLEEGVGGSNPRFLNLLKKLKEKELREKPYLFSNERSKDSAGKVSPSERDRVVGTALSVKLFGDRVGGAPSFFDLPPEEVDMLIKKEVEKSGPMNPTEIASRAKEYAEEYTDFLKKHTSWKALSEELRKYLRLKFSLAISEEQADRLEREVNTRGVRRVVVRGRDVGTGTLREMMLSVSTIFDKVVHPIIKNYEKRVQYLQFLQNNRKNVLAKQKAELRRKLVEETEEGEIEPIDDSKYKDTVISLFRNYAKYSHEGDTPGKIPSRYRIYHGLPAAEEKNKELAALRTEAATLGTQFKKLENELHKTYAPFEKAIDNLGLFRDDMAYLTSKDPKFAENGILDIIDNVQQLVGQIKKAVTQREFVRKFPGQNSAEQIKEISDSIQASVAGIESHKISLHKDIPQKYSLRLSEIFGGLRKAVNAYESIAKSAEEKMAQINLRLEAIRDEKGKIAEEIT